jgi:K+-transporting ATPase KdpF subunit
MHQILAASCNVALRTRQKAQQIAVGLNGTRTALKLRHDGSRFHRGKLRFLRDRDHVRVGMYPLMTTWELILGSVMALGLTVYLLYAMLRPEKF